MCLFIFSVDFCMFILPDVCKICFARGSVGGIALVCVLKYFKAKHFAWIQILPSLFASLIHYVVKRGMDAWKQQLFPTSASVVRNIMKQKTENSIPDMYIYIYNITQLSNLGVCVIFDCL